MINGMKPLIIFTKRFILDISQGSKYEIFLRFCLIFTILLSQNPPKNHHRPLKNVWHQTNLLSLFEMHVKDFDKIVI